MPERTCVGCRSKRPANEMARLCLTVDGELIVSSHSIGRGAWICRDSVCFEKVKRSGKLERALQVKSILNAQNQLSTLCEELGF